MSSSEVREGTTNGVLGDTLRLSFEPPFHSMCVSRQAIFTSADSSSKDYLDLNTVKIDSLLGSSQPLENLPDIFKIGKKRYQYCGVSDGQAFYREI